MRLKIICRVLIALIIAGVVLAIGLSDDESAVDYEPSEIIDILVDAGLGCSESQIDNDLLEHRKIVVTTDINAISSQRVIKGLLLLDAIDDTAPIDLYIRTEGGWVSDAFGIIDVMENIRAPVNTHAVGGAFSAGAMILAAGTGTRYGLPNCSIMFHAGLYEDDAEFSEDRLDNERLITFWKAHAHLPAEWLNQREDEAYYLTAEKALEYGIIDQIESKAKSPSQQIEGLHEMTPQR
ncbi:MAG: ATP-dependent Clp protease proteolytic subunit [Pontiellaceae bacterium]|nr:ATP-dependent Clp protease proteolytic subunit [Pontiellaceae bacterium]